LNKAATLLESVMNRGREIAIVAVVSLLPAGSAFAQCAMCGTALQDADGPLQRGLFWSVVFLISLPYSIVAGFVAFLYWRHRQTRTANRPVLRLVTASGGKEVGR
jgi:hypothetical protein